MFGVVLFLVLSLNYVGQLAVIRTGMDLGDGDYVLPGVWCTDWGMVTYVVPGVWCTDWGMVPYVLPGM